jgi:4-amino-4-deoxy-L-arabinose transferase-like glycosyltransferase
MRSIPRTTVYPCRVATAIGVTEGWTRADRNWLGALFGVSLALRLLHLLTLRDSPFFLHLMLDPLMYDEWGRSIAAGAWIGERAFFQDPLYAYFLGIFYALVGPSHVALVALQCFLGALVAPLLYLATWRWLGRAPAAVAGLLAAVYPAAIYYDGLILKTSLTVVLVALTLWLLSRALSRPPGESSGSTWLWVGAALGLAGLTRGNLTLFVPVLTLWVGLRPDAGSKRGRSRAALREALLLLAGALLVLLPATLHNRVAAGEWILTTSNAGQNFYIGNNPLNLSGEYQRLPFVDPNPRYEQRDFAREAARRSGRELGAAQTSRFWFLAALDWIGEEPAAWLRLCRRKLAAYWGAYEIPDNLDFYLYRESAPLLRLPAPGFGLVAPLGLLGMVLAWRRPGWPRLLILFVALYSFSVVLFFVFSRFRMAMMPALFVFAGYGVVELVQRTRGAFGPHRQPGPLLRATALLLALLALVNLPVRARADSWSYRLARAVRLPVRAETSAQARFNLGVAYAAAAGDREDPAPLLRLAEEQLRESLRREAGFAIVHIELGKVLARQGRDREAIESYLVAERLEPRNYLVQHALGLLFRREEDLAAAEQRFRRALQLAPGHTPSARRLEEVQRQRSATSP